MPDNTKSAQSYRAKRFFENSLVRLCAPAPSSDPAPRRSYRRRQHDAHHDSTDRPDRDRYIVRYWKGVSGLPLGPAPTLDCVGYDPNNLSVKSAGDDGWLLVDGGHQMLLLDTANDAERARMMASGYSKLCFIGRDNTRPNRHRYILEFWRQ